MISGTPISGETISGTPGAFQAVNTLFITDTIDNMKLPINCVVAGQQKEPIKKAMGLDGAISSPLRGIFGE